jgi:hypothetical protein
MKQKRSKLRKEIEQATPYSYKTKSSFSDVTSARLKRKIKK